MADGGGRNPYPGLRPFEAGDSGYFFGRETESRQLGHLIVAHRVVLLYAQSGAGKTSLLKAGVIPRLEATDSMVVLPITRAGGSLPPGLDEARPANVFVFNTLYGLAGEARDIASLADVTLRDGLRPYLQDAAEGALTSPRLLILDQFEEIFTNHPERLNERAEFFRQLQSCLQELPQLSLLISMREDYIAELDPYAAQMPDRLRTRFRLERLNAESALEAVRGPAEKAGTPFESGVAEALVDDLRRLQPSRDRAGGGPTLPSVTHEEPLSEYVEPVYLQIVCHQLWEDLPDNAQTIRQEDVQSFGDVDEALTSFYRATLATVQGETGIAERRLRLWIERQMITPAGTRGLVYRGEAETGGLPNEAADGFYARYLVRRVMRGGDTYYELAHDRLVFPLRNDNATWLKANQNALLSQAESWDERQRPGDLLLRGDSLVEAERWAAAHEAELTDSEREFLRQSRDAQAVAERDAQQAKRIRRLAIAAGLLALVFAAALAASLVLLATVREQQQLALARQLAAQSAAYRADQLDLSLLLGVEANRIAGEIASGGGILNLLQPSRVMDTTDARGSLLTALETNAPLVAYLRAYSDTVPVARVAFAAAGSIMATGGTDGRVFLWDARTQPVRLGQELPDAPSDVTALAFGAGARWLAAGGRDGDITLWDLSGGDGGAITAPGLAAHPPVSRSWQAHAGQVSDLAFLPGGETPMLISAGKRDAALWDLTADGSEPLRTFGNDKPIFSMALSPDGGTLATGHEGVIEFWSVPGLLEPLQAGDVVTSTARYPVPDGQVDALSYGTGPAAGMLAVATSPAGSGKKKGADASASDFAERPLVALLPLSPDAAGLRAPDPAMPPCTGAGGRCKIMDGVVRSLALGAAAQPDHLTAQLAATDGRAISVWQGAEDVEAFARADAQTLTGHRDLVLDIAWDENGKRLVSGAMDGLAILWEPAARPRLGEDRLLGPPKPPGVQQRAGGPAGIFAVAFSPDGKRLASGGEAQATQLWDIATGTAITLTDTLSDTIRSVAFSPAGSWLAAAKEHGALALWDVGTDTAAPISLAHSPGQPAVSVAFSPDGDQLASGGFDSTVQLWDLRASIPISQEIGALPGKVFGVAFGPDGRTLSAAGADGLGGRLETWNLPISGSPVFTATHDTWLLSLAAGPDGKHLAAGSDQGDIQLWDSATHAATTLPASANAATLGLAFNPAEPEMLASANADGAVILWDTTVRRPIGAPLRGHDPGMAVDSVAFSPDGNRLASAGDDQAIVLWDLDPASWQIRACRVATRNLTPDEWRRYLGAEPYRKTCPDLP